MQPKYLYIHAPFCARRCSYCDFAVTVDREPRPGPWLDSVEAELAAHVSREGWKRLHLQTIYVGGGTPSLFGVGVMRALAERLRRFADWDETVEWTAEANPEHFGITLARDWLAAGVNRLSLGAQTFDVQALRWMGRLHGPDGPRRALEAARAAGFGNTSIDLIFGLPARLERDWSADLDRVIEMAPEHVSLYGLTAEAGAPLGKWVAESREMLADEEVYAAEYLEADRRLGESGFVHYEVSNFTLPGRESRHNGAYWTGAPYIGLGPGAHSYLPPRRFWNVRDWAAYRGRVTRDGSATDGQELIEGDGPALEAAWLGLRTRDGAEIRSAAQRALSKEWSARGLATGGDGRIRLTPRGWLLLDRLAIEFADAGPKPAAAARKSSVSVKRRTAPRT